MPVRSLRSSVLRWPDRDEVDRAVRAWAVDVAARDAVVRRVGYFGSYARGDWGVGSDVDVVVVAAESSQPFDRRPLAFDPTELPVPADCWCTRRPNGSGCRSAAACRGSSRARSFGSSSADLGAPVLPGATDRPAWKPRPGPRSGFLPQSPWGAFSIWDLESTP
ncbi:MAG: nucleotidyltransferase domain-containing protein [Actinomycetota bacterium]